MKKYDKPLITNFHNGSFILAEAASVFSSVLAVTVAKKIADKMFDSSFANAQRLGSLEPVIA